VLSRFKPRAFSIQTPCFLDSNPVLSRFKPRAFSIQTPCFLAAKYDIPLGGGEKMSLPP
jgi:hypothetical protein